MDVYAVTALFFGGIAVCVPQGLIRAGRIQRDNYYPVFSDPRDIAEYLALFLSGTVFAVAEYCFCGLGISAFAATAAVLLIYYSVKTARMRKKFVFTARAVRMYFLYAAMQFALAVTVFALRSTPAAIAFTALVVALNKSVMSLAAAVILPFEKANNRRYLKFYAEKYINLNCIRIAVTGSYGKTGVKNMLKTALEGHYTVAMSEGNYNTPFGIVKSLETYGNEQVFIAEFGARRKGDIDELTTLLKPDYAVITGVARQHIKTFKSVENVAAEKARLGAALEDKSRLVLNGGNEYTRQMREKYFPEATLAGEYGEVRAEKITETPDGLRFLLSCNGEKRAVSFPLHGSFNAANAAMAAAVALKLGVPLKDIAARLKNVKPVEHRFEVKKEGGVTIIDDGYNSNIDGAKESVKSLKVFPGRKIVVAQGITELGKEQKNVNAEFARALSEVATVVILTGENAACLYKTLKSCGFGGRIIRVDRFKAVENALAGLVEPGDVIWFQNDIPE